MCGKNKRAGYGRKPDIQIRHPFPRILFAVFPGQWAALELHVEVEEELRLSALVSPEDGESLTGAIADAIRAYQYGGGRSSWGEVRKLTLNFGQDHGDVVVRLDGDQTPDPETPRRLTAVLKGKKSERSAFRLGIRLYNSECLVEYRKKG